VPKATFRKLESSFSQLGPWGANANNSSTLQASTVLGGMRSADIGLNLQYANLNQPQTITAPKTVRPYSEFTTKIQAFVQSLQGSLGARALLGSSNGSGSSGSTSGSGSGSASGSGSTGAGISKSVKALQRVHLGGRQRHRQDAALRVTAER
jgi:hypothetical protein